MRRANAMNSLGVRFWSRKKMTRFSRNARRICADRVIVEIAREIDAVDFGAKRAGDPLHFQSAVRSHDGFSTLLQGGGV